MICSRRSAWRAPALVLAVFLALVFPTPALAAVESLDFTFTVAGAEPPVFSSDELAGGELATGANDFTLTLCNPEAGEDYAAVAVRLELSGAGGRDAVRLAWEETPGQWVELSLDQQGDALVSDFLPAGALARGDMQAFHLRLTLGGNLRDAALTLTAAAYDASGAAPAAIAGAATSFGLAVKGPATTLGPTVPDGSPPAFGVEQTVAVDFTLSNAAAAGYENLGVRLTLSGVPADVALTGPEALTLSMEAGGEWETVALTRSVNGDIGADLIPAAGLALAPGARLTLPLKLRWPAGSAGTYTWSATIVANPGAADEWTLARDDLGSIQVLTVNVTCVLSADRLDFGLVPVGTSWSNPVQVTVTNTGNVAEQFNIKATAAAGAYQPGEDFYVLMRYDNGSRELLLNRSFQLLSQLEPLAPGASTTFELRLRAKAGAMPPGTYHFTLAVESQPAG
ncbi:MAG TPA: hypothetical protein GXX50_07770 [Firmicutes bacterium]|nr:hypothetical protein [Bacillota bacterium]